MNVTCGDVYFQFKTYLKLEKYLLCRIQKIGQAIGYFRVNNTGNPEVTKLKVTKGLDRSQRFWNVDGMMKVFWWVPQSDWMWKSSFSVWISFSITIYLWRVWHLWFCSCCEVYTCTSVCILVFHTCTCLDSAWWEDVKRMDDSQESEQCHDTSVNPSVVVQQPGSYYWICPSWKLALPLAQEHFYTDRFLFL